MDTDHHPLLREADSAADRDPQGAADLRWEDHLWEDHLWEDPLWADPRWVDPRWVDPRWADLLRSAGDTDPLRHHLLRHLRREDGAAVFLYCLFLSVYLRQRRYSASNVKVTAVSLT